MVVVVVGSRARARPASSRSVTTTRVDQVRKFRWRRFASSWGLASLARRRRPTKGPAIDPTTTASSRRRSSRHRGRAGGRRGSPRRGSPARRRSGAFGCGNFRTPAAPIEEKSVNGSDQFQFSDSAESKDEQTPRKAGQTRRKEASGDSRHATHSTKERPACTAPCQFSAKISLVCLVRVYMGCFSRL